ncbi:MAG: transcriptional regulator [Pseudomonadota bacterium]
MKAIIELGYRGDALAQARHDLAMAQTGADVDYHLVFESARTLFSELTPARIDTLDFLRLHGPMSIYALAKDLKRNYSNVHADVEKLLEHGLVEKDADNLISAPWDAIEIRMAQAKVA